MPPTALTPHAPFGIDRKYMRTALCAALQAEGRTAPNPMVGCTIVRDGVVVGRGWHVRAGCAHAEVMALAQAGEAAFGADVYITLEPCHHTGRTGPCTRALLDAGVGRVIVGSRDPNPKVNGRGIRALRAAGVPVVTGVLGAACQRLNEAFNTAIVNRRVFVVAKLAQSLDGAVATRSGASKWITGPVARADGQAWRNRLDAIVVGSTTVLSDDPQLTCRLPEGRDPMRVVLDARARTPISARLLPANQPASVAQVIICVGPDAAPEACMRLEAAGAAVWRCPKSPHGPGGVDVAFVAQKLFAAGALSLLVEGGPKVQGAFFDAQLVDRVVAYVAPMLIGGATAHHSVAGIGPAALAGAPRLVRPVWRKLGADMSMTSRVAYADAEPAP